MGSESWAQVLVGNKCDVNESERAVPFSRGQALADELGIPFFEASTSHLVNVTEVRHRQPLSRLGAQPLMLPCVAKTGQCVQVFERIATDVMARLQGTQSSQGGSGRAAGPQPAGTQDQEEWVLVSSN